jgi:RecB family exonuclease
VPSDVVSNSQLQTFKRCRRKYWLTYVRKLKPRSYAKTGARQLGTRVHGALQAYYAGFISTGPDIIVGNQVEGLTAALAWLDELRRLELAEAGEDGQVVADVEKEHALAVTMVEGYAQWLEESGADSDLETIANEHALRAPSPVAGVELIGKLDRVVRKVSDGSVGFVDYKTVGDLQTPLKHLGMDEQFRMYALMQKLLNRAVGFHIYRMLKKSKRTERAKPPFFRDYEVYINDEELRAFWERLHGELLELLRFEAQIAANPTGHRFIAYPTPTTNCSWDCDFYPVCPMFDDSRSDPEHLLAMNYQVGDPHAHYEGQLQA